MGEIDTKTGEHTQQTQETQTESQNKAQITATSLWNLAHLNATAQGKQKQLSQFSNLHSLNPPKSPFINQPTATLSCSVQT